MKKTLVIFLLTLSMFSCKKEESLPDGEYEIRVTANGIYNGVRAYLRPTINTRNRNSSSAKGTAIVANGKFIFKGKIDNPSIQYLTINSINGSFQMILEPGVTHIEVYKDSISSSKIIQAPENNQALVAYKNGFKEKALALNDIKTKMNTARLNSKPKEYQSLYEESLPYEKALNDFPFEFIQKNKKTDFSVLLLGKLIEENKANDIDNLKKSMIAIGGNLFKKNSFNQKINQKLNIHILRKEAEARVDIGKVAPNFTGTTPDGKTISLNDIKGKVTIIDFWAAWCAPCRVENPNIVRLYEKYHDKGLEIISVGLDGRTGQENPKEAWLKAIENDNLNWHHVSNLKYFNDPAVKLYNVNSIPSSFILDENGVIAAKKLRGFIPLENKILELLSL